jgi:squalene synthase HpnC
MDANGQYRSSNDKRMYSLDLQPYGPQAQGKPPGLREARLYCRELAKRHYENFAVAGWLSPRRLRQHFYNIYAYCRWADDLADEVRDDQQSLALLTCWEGQLRDCYQGRATHPVFVALAETIAKFNIPVDPFLDLLSAFRQDREVSRYETFEDLLSYCRRSANPVGRLVLYLSGCHAPQRVAPADSICTGLQLANFCQDVAGDWDRGRIYLPQDECRQLGYAEAMFAGRQCNDAFRRLMALQVGRAERYLRAGLPLVDMMPRELRLDVLLFVHGGLAILRRIRRRNYDVWTGRPTVSKMEKVKILVQCCWRNLVK